MLPKAIFFDLDDTLLNDSKAADLGWHKACKTFSENMGLFRGEDLFLRINTIRKRYWSDAKRNLSGDEGRINYHHARMMITRSALSELGYNYTEKIVEGIVDIFSEVKLECIGFFPDTEVIIRELQKRTIKLALLTNGDGSEQRAKIEKFGMMKLFNPCLVEGELGYGKPDPRIYEMALNELQVKPYQTWMVGNDLYSDIAGAQRMGIYSIWCDYGQKGLPEGSLIIPDRIINNLTELLTE